MSALSQRQSTRKPKLNVLSKADRLLEQLAVAGDLTISELAEASGEPRSSVYRLVATLEELGFVTSGRQPNTYQLGMQLYRLGNLVPARFQVRQAALGAMKRLFDATGETVFLMVRHGDTAVCIERIEGRRVKSMAVVIGGSLPLHLGAAPLVLLSDADDENIERYLSKPLASFTRYSITDKNLIRERLRRVRDEGLAISDQDLVLGIAALGAPIRDTSGMTVAAISFSGARRAILEDALERNASLLRDAAESVRPAKPGATAI